MYFIVERHKMIDPTYQWRVFAWRVGKLGLIYKHGFLHWPKQYLCDAKFDKVKADYLIEGFSHEFDTGYVGPMNRRD